MDPRRKINQDIFGSKLPVGLRSRLADLAPLFTESIFKKYVLSRDVWAVLPREQQTELFLARQEKTLLPAYRQYVQNPDALGVVILSKLAGKPSAKICNGAAAFMTAFSQKADEKMLRQLWEALKPLENAAEALQAIEADEVLMGILQK